jgi:hypothetical protein
MSSPFTDTMMVIVAAAAAVVKLHIATWRHPCTDKALQSAAATLNTETSLGK